MKDLYTNWKNKIAKFRESPPESGLNTEWLLIDRIIDKKGKGEDRKYLVKWRSLGYEQATWEKGSTLEEKVSNFEERLQYFEEINSKENMRRAQLHISRPRPSELKSKEDIQLPAFREGLKLKTYQVKKKAIEHPICLLTLFFLCAKKKDEGVRWLIHCWYNRRNSILADEMGLGKTIQASAMLEYLHTQRNIFGPFLVVAPMSTLEQWKRELELWTTLNVVQFHGSAEARFVLFCCVLFFLFLSSSHVLLLCSSEI
jgi:SNF2 family DNA or RNA helicase